MPNDIRKIHPPHGVHQSIVTPGAVGVRSALAGSPNASIITEIPGIDTGSPVIGPKYGITITIVEPTLPEDFRRLVSSALLEEPLHSIFGMDFTPFHAMDIIERSIRTIERKDGEVRSFIENRIKARNLPDALFFLENLLILKNEMKIVGAERLLDLCIRKIGEAKNSGGIYFEAFLAVNLQGQSGNRISVNEVVPNKSHFGDADFDLLGTQRNATLGDCFFEGHDTKFLERDTTLLGEAKLSTTIDNRVPRQLRKLVSASQRRADSQAAMFFYRLPHVLEIADSRTPIWGSGVNTQRDFRVAARSNLSDWADITCTHGKRVRLFDHDGNDCTHDVIALASKYNPN